MADDKPRTTSVQVDPGLPGLVEYLVSVFAKDGVPLGPPTGSAGKYTAMFTMWRGTTRSIGEYEVSAGEGIRGDSHLAMAKPAYEPRGNPDANELRMELTTDRGEEFSVVVPRTRRDSCPSCKSNRSRRRASTTPMARRYGRCR